MPYKLYKKLLGSKVLEIPEKVEINNISWPVVLEVKSKKTSSCSLRGNKLVLSLSSRMSRHNQQKTANDLLGRMARHLEKTGIKARRQKNFRDRQKIKTVFGNTYLIHIDPNPGSRSRAVLRGGKIQIKFAAGISRREIQQHINELVRKILSKKERANIEEYINQLNIKYFEGKLKIGRVRFKKQVSLWGSCSRHNNINLSFNLLLCPKKILKYICIHEMCHILHRNHSRSFWQEVERVLPDYKESERWLRRQ